MAIQQHPLPQDISAYRFRLIGDMTIKQFVSLGIGIVMSILFYSSPLPFFFKYPLAFVFLLLGVGAAFVPVQGRTLDTWILAFLRSIYAPTQFVWKQTALENITSDTASPTSAANQQLAPVVSNAKMQISTGIVPSSTAPTPITPTVTITPPTTEAAPPAVPQTIIPQKSVLDNTISALSQPTDIPTQEANPVILVSPLAPDLAPGAAEESHSSTSTASISPSFNPPISPPASTIVIPASEPESIQITPAATPPIASQLPIPYTPTTPNTLVGLTITPDSKILDGVLVEIQKNGLTSRATKSNKLGQFMFARPLEDGLYQIFAEKDGFSFAPYSLELTGTIIRPLKIQAQ